MGKLIKQTSKGRKQDRYNPKKSHRWRSKEPWERGRGAKRKVTYIMKATENNNYIECNALRERALNKGVAYDEVDWDELQGADLVYEDRVRRLDRQVGKTYTDEEFELEQEKYAQMGEEWSAREGR